MKLTNGDIFGAQQSLKQLIEYKLPVLTSYKLVKLVNKLNEQFTIIDDVREGLIKKYGGLNDKGQMSVKQGTKEWDKFIDEFNELLEQEVELVIEKVKLPDTIEIEPSVLMPLEKFIVM